MTSHALNWKTTATSKMANNRLNYKENTDPVFVPKKFVEPKWKLMCAFKNTWITWNSCSFGKLKSRKSGLFQNVIPFRHRPKPTHPKGRTTRKVMGGEGVRKKPKKNSCKGKYQKKKIRAKKKVKRCRGFHLQKKFLPKQRAKKKFVQAEISPPPSLF